MIEIGRVVEYWTRWKGLEVTPTTAPYFRSNKSLYEERLRELHKLRDEIIFDSEIPASYKDSLTRQVLDSITILGRPNKNEVEELINYGTTFVSGVAAGAIGREILRNAVEKA